MWRVIKMLNKLLYRIKKKIFEGNCFVMSCVLIYDSVDEKLV